MLEFHIFNSYVYVQSEFKEDHNTIYDALSYKIDKNTLYNMQRRTGNYSWDGTKSFYSKRDKKFLTGLLDEVLQFCDKKGIGYNLVEHRDLSPAEFGDYQLKGITLYDFQEDAIQALFNNRRGILKLSTGSGKGLIAKCIFKSINRPTLFLTHRINLMQQMIKRFQNRLPEYKDKIGVIGGGEYYPNFLTFGTVQTIHSALKRGDEEIKAILDKFEVIIVDEAHRMKSDQFSEVVSACNNATFRCALTATPFMRDDHEENQRLIGGIGNIIAETTNKDLVDAGILAKPYVKYVKVEKPDNIRHLQNYREVYENGITNNKYRNELVVSQAQSLLKVRDKILVIVTEIKHGENLKELFQKNGIETEFCSGSMSVSDRAKLLKKLENGKLNVLIASTIFDEGIDIKAIGGVVLAGGGKSVPALYQRIGRSMRKKKEDNYCVIIDFWDMTHRILNKHSKQRYKVVEEDEAFTILGG